MSTKEGSGEADWDVTVVHSRFCAATRRFPAACDCEHDKDKCQCPKCATPPTGDPAVTPKTCCEKGRANLQLAANAIGSDGPIESYSCPVHGWQDVQRPTPDNGGDRR